MTTTLTNAIQFTLLIGLLGLVACQPTAPTEFEAQQRLQHAERQALEEQYDQAVREQRQTATTNATISSLLPQQAAQLLKTAQTLYNIDSNQLQNTNSSLAESNAPTPHGGLLFKVRDYEQAYANIQTLTQSAGVTLLSETEQTTDYNRGMLLQLQTQDIDQTIDQLRALATVLRKKERWQPNNNHYHYSVKSDLVVNQQRIYDLSEQLKQTESINEQLLLKKALADLSKEVERTVLQLKAQAVAPNSSILTVAFYEEPALPAPAPQNFSADFSGNLKAGWIQFKGFLLQAALYWPYIVLGLLFLIVIALAVGSSRRKARQFKLQLLHKQQPVVQPVVVPKPPQV